MSLYLDEAYLRKLAVTVLFGAVAAVLLILCVVSFFRINRINTQLKQSKSELINTEEELKRLQLVKESLTKQNDKYQADVISYLALNSKLSDENEEYGNNLRKAQKVIEDNAAELQRLKNLLDSPDGTSKTAKPAVSGKERDILLKKIKKLESLLTKERSYYHYNLGVSYTKSELYDEAIKEYKAALKLNPNDPDTNYNLGILYDKYKNNPDTAAIYYKKYLQLNPKAVDKEEVESWIKGNFLEN